METSNQFIGFRCTEAQRRAIEAGAKIDGSTFTSFILGAVRHEVARRAEDAFRENDDDAFGDWVRVGVFLETDNTLENFSAEVRKERALIRA